MKDRPERWQNRAHFCAIAAHSMRQILIERARARGAQKRGGAQPRVTLDEALVAGESPSIDLVALDEALGRLEQIDPEQARLVELRFFGGLTDRGDRRSHEHLPRHRQAPLGGGARVAGAGARGRPTRVTPERWRQINELFHAASPSCDPAGREAAPRRDRRRHDPELAAEVRSLLATHKPRRRVSRTAGMGGRADPGLRRNRSPAPAQMVGPYRIIREIGRGGMGVVYEAEDTRLRPLRRAQGAPLRVHDAIPMRRERLTREARAAAALTHPSIATIFALDELDGELYLVSELVRGETLREELARGPLAGERLLATLIDLAAGLAAAHAAGIVHRDFKPENIVRCTDGRVKILDFGLARAPSERAAPHADRASRSARPGYMPPEQLTGEDVDARTDVFAFGVVAWELATGAHPFGANAAGDARAHDRPARRTCGHDDRTAAADRRARTDPAPLPAPQSRRAISVGKAGTRRCSRRCVCREPRQLRRCRLPNPL